MIDALEFQEAVASTFQDRPEADTAPVCFCPWLENPYRLVSLWDMLQFEAANFVTCSASLMKYWQGLRHGAAITDRGVQELGFSLTELQRGCQKHKLQSTLNQINRIQQYFRDNTGITKNTLSQLVGEVIVRLEEDLRGQTFMALGPTDAAYYEPLEPLFGKAVHESFPSTVYDITEAGKCYALRRPTACVFHLMRTLEIGLRVVAERFNVPSDRANWHNIIEALEKAIRGMSNDPARASDWKDQQEFFSGAATQFMFVKDAWRNYVAHAREKSTEDEAEKIFHNVRAFMQKLATRLHE